MITLLIAGCSGQPAPGESTPDPSSPVPSPVPGALDTFPDEVEVLSAVYPEFPDGAMTIGESLREYTWDEEGRVVDFRRAAGFSDATRDDHEEAVEFYRGVLPDGGWTVTEDGLRVADGAHEFEFEGHDAQGRLSVSLTTLTTDPEADTPDEDRTTLRINVELTRFVETADPHHRPQLPLPSWYDTDFPPPPDGWTRTVTSYDYGNLGFVPENAADVDESITFRISYAYEDEDARSESASDELLESVLGHYRTVIPEAAWSLVNDEEISRPADESGYGGVRGWRLDYTAHATDLSLAVAYSSGPDGPTDPVSVNFTLQAADVD